MYIPILCKKDDIKLVTTEEYISHAVTSFEAFKERGEPYIYPTEIPLILFLGPRTYWRLGSYDFPTFGEGLDPEDLDEVEEVLELRRKGYVWGRWFSKYCREGETGYQHYRDLAPINFQEFTLAVDRIERHDTSGL